MPVVQLTPHLQHISHRKKSQNVDFMHRVDCGGVLHMLVTVQMFWSTSPMCSSSPRPAVDICGHLTCFSWSRTFGSTNQSQYVSYWIRTLKCYYMRWLKKRADELWWSSIGSYADKSHQNILFSQYLQFLMLWRCFYYWDTSFDWNIQPFPPSVSA